MSSVHLHSPTKPQAGSMQTFSSHFDGASSRGVLKEDLHHRVVFGVEGLLETYFAIHKFDNSTVHKYVGGLRSRLTDEFMSLKKAVRDGDEKEMYLPVSSICRDIEQAADFGTRSYHRQIIQTSESKLNDEGQMLPHLKPDFVIIDVPSSLEGLVNVRQALRRQVSAFIEVKPTEKDCPMPTTRSDTIKELTVQAADYAGLIFSSRPFHLFAVGVVIYGMKFAVAIFDRAGGLFSSEYDIEKDLHIFVCVIRRLTCDMGLVQLGHDPTVQLWENDTYYDSRYPRFKVSMGGKDDTRCWTTKGHPMWVSLSLFGRGTSVWHAIGLHGRCVLKVAWRDADRTSESDIYGRIGIGHPGVAKFLAGGDVIFPAPLTGIAVKVAVQHLRSNLGVHDTLFHNRILHRVTIRPVGRPLWKYDIEDDLFNGLLAVVAGHEFLTNRGILHRDISAGNVFLFDPRENDTLMAPGQEGFLADVELASMPQPLTEYQAQPAGIQPPAGSGPFLMPIPSQHLQLVQIPSGRKEFAEIPSQPKGKHGPDMTGTAQFMAIEVLRAVVNKSPPVPRDICHDLESLLWVIMYAIYRRTIESVETGNAELQREFVAYFGGSTVSKILDTRRRAQEAQPELRKCINSPRLRHLLNGCSLLLVGQNPARGLDEHGLELEADARLYGRTLPTPQRITYADIRVMLTSGQL